MSLGSDRRGAIAVMVALAATGLMSVGAFAIDYGLIAVAERQAQGAADIAAMLAASDPANADARARRSLADNGYGAADAVTVVAGRYDGDPSLPVARRFAAGASPANAVRVVLRSTARTHFTHLLGLPRAYPVVGSGTAATSTLAAFTIGSGLAALDGGIANAVLGALVGTRLSLSAMDYDALASARLDSFRVLDALGGSLGLDAGSYQQILDAQASFGQIAAALSVAGQASASAAAALDRLSSVRTGTRMRIGDVIDLGDAAALGVGRGSRGPDVTPMSVISAAAALANGERQVQVDLGATVPGLTRTRLTLAIGERRQSSGFVRVGSPNATVRTAQTKLLIEASLTAPLGLGSLDLPLYAEAAFATARLRETTCPWNAAGRREVRLDVQPGILDLAIAEVPASAITPRGPSPDVSRAARLISTPLVTVQGRARATLGSPSAQIVSFNDDDIAHHRIRSVGSTGLTQSLTRSLLDSLTLNPDASPVLRSALSGRLLSAAPALDTILDATLRVLGLRLGTADVSIDGTRCDHAVLVQ